MKSNFFWMTKLGVAHADTHTRTKTLRMFIHRPLLQYVLICKNNDVFRFVEFFH